MYQLIRGKPISEINFTCERGTSGKYKNKLVCNNIFTFDTETTSDYVDENGNVIMFDYDNPDKCKNALKHSVCYLWQFGIDEDTRYIGRELTDFSMLLFELMQYISVNAIKIIYVHNLSFDANFIQNIIKFDNVFARTPRHPMSIFSNYYGIEFKCSYVLTGLKLETWANSLNLPVKKKVGLLDYRVLRTPLTPLDKDTIDYAIADLDVMYYGLLKFRTKYGAMWKIPLTHTGEMRYACENVMEDEKYYCYDMTKLLPQTLDEYIKQAHAFIGGTVLCNWLYKRRTIHNVECWDIASSYPFVILNNLYPSTVFQKVPRGREREYMQKKEYLYLIHFTAYNIESRFNCHFLSRNKAISLSNCLADNGRIVSADKVEAILTSVDFEIFEKCYKHDLDKFEIHEMKVSRGKPLNNTFRRFVVDLYKNKTTLKGVPDKEELYQNSKSLVNACYGDLVTKVFSDEVTYDYANKDKVWDYIRLDDVSFNKKLANINRKAHKNYKAFIVGVFVTAHARARIWDFIINGGDSYLVYTDTDSLKVVNYNGTFFKDRNKVVLTRLKEIAKELDIPLDDLQPLDIKGKRHPIGVWEQEPTCTSFRSLGCKQYIAEYEDGSLHLTCAGVSKLAVKLFKNIDDFDINRTLTEKELLSCDDGNGHTAEKLTPYYSVDYPVVTYPDGYVCKYKSGVCLMPTTFNLSITPNDLKLLYGVVAEKLNQCYYRKDIRNGKTKSNMGNKSKNENKPKIRKDNKRNT